MVTDATDLTGLSWAPPAGWHLIAPGDDVPRWIDDVVARATSSTSNADRLRGDLARLVPEPPPRHIIAAVAPVPELASRVLAAGWLEFGPVIDTREIAEAMRSAPLPASVLSRDIDVRESRRRPAVLCRDLVAGTGDSRQLLHERCAAIVVHASLEVSVRIELSTSDLHAFDDIGATCLQAADAFRVAERGVPS